MRSDDGKQAKESEDALLAALVSIHRQNQERSRASSPDAAYARIVSHFERRGERLRGERIVTAELIDRLLGANAALGQRRVQRELEIEGPPGGVAAGRLRVHNRAASSREFELIAGEPVAGHAAARLELEPQRGKLEAGGACWVRVCGSLLGFQPGDSATVPLECRWHTGSDRVWVVVSAHPELGSR